MAIIIQKLQFTGTIRAAKFYIQRHLPLITGFRWRRRRRRPGGRKKLPVNAVVGTRKLLCSNHVHQLRVVLTHNTRVRRHYRAVNLHFYCTRNNVVAAVLYNSREVFSFALTYISAFTKSGVETLLDIVFRHTQRAQEYIAKVMQNASLCLKHPGGGFLHCTFSTTIEAVSC